jgi:hypothetical protein
VTGYSTEGWGDLFVAAAGATAALSGLIFVGLSVNIQEVLEIEKRDGSNYLTGRAIEALVALLNVLVISLVALTPMIHRWTLACFILLTAVTSAISPARATYAGLSAGHVSAGTASRIGFACALTWTLIAAGVTLVAGHGGGLDWLPAAFVLAILVAAINAWVLLVEILR